MKIGIVKPDYGIVGGFELVLDRVMDGLRADGHTPVLIPVDVRDLNSPLFGVPVPTEQWAVASEFFRYMAVVERCRHAEVGRVDLLVSTLPGSVAARHPRHMAMMYHHQRVFYDLADAFVEGGFVDAEIHAACVASVREVDSRLLADVAGVLACSEEFDRRLMEFNGMSSIGIFHAGIGSRADRTSRPAGPGNGVLCVSRNEFPKRTELFAQAAAVHGRASRIIGSGGRLPWVAELARQWDEGEADPLTQDPKETWLRQVPADFRGPPQPSRIGSLELSGHVSSDELDNAYASARCVVAPAYREDYGLTAIEAMSHGRPVVVCSDGGGLVEFVQDGISGFVVDPAPAAIAEAVDRLASDDDLAMDMGAAALRRSREYTWERGWAEIRAAIEEMT